MRRVRSLLLVGTAGALLSSLHAAGVGRPARARPPPRAPRRRRPVRVPRATVHEIVVTNDDGVAAPGIDAVVTALRAVPGVHVDVVAPAKNQSGTGGKTTSGTLTYTASKTASGYPATAVNGYPADTITVALDQLHLHPSLVVSGANLGQNLGPVTNLSGTVGAAKAAVSRGVPALAVSAGVGSPVDYQIGGTVRRHLGRQLLQGQSVGDTHHRRQPQRAQLLDRQRSRREAAAHADLDPEHGGCPVQAGLHVHCDTRRPRSRPSTTVSRRSRRSPRADLGPVK